MDGKAKGVYEKALELLGSLGNEDDDPEVVDTVLNLSQVLYNYAAKRRSTDQTSVTESPKKEKPPQQQGTNENFDPSAEFEKLERTKSPRVHPPENVDKLNNLEQKEIEKDGLGDSTPKDDAVAGSSVNGVCSDESTAIPMSSTSETSKNETESESLPTIEPAPSPQPEADAPEADANVIMIMTPDTSREVDSVTEVEERSAGVKRKTTSSDANIVASPAKRKCSEADDSADVERPETHNESHSSGVRVSGRKRKVTARVREYMENLGIKIEPDDSEYQNVGRSQRDKHSSKDPSGKLTLSPKVALFRLDESMALPVTLKARGRPRKTPVPDTMESTELESPSPSSSAKTSEGNVPKQGRGRPPKIVNSDETTIRNLSDSAVEPNQTRKGRSSTPKEGRSYSTGDNFENVGDITANLMASEMETPKRGRGRPRKFPPISTEDKELETGESSSPSKITPVKRGRGRPPKTPQIEPEMEEHDESYSEPEKPKRGRGRPRKTPESHSSETAGADGTNTECQAAGTPGSEPLKRGRGRPRKTPIRFEISDDDESPSTPVTTTPKRGRGRPPKNPLDRKVGSTPSGSPRKRGRPPKKGLGRPPKSPHGITNADKSPVKKPRPGRPRKQPLSEDTDGEIEEMLIESESEYEKEEEGTTADEAEEVEEEEAKEGYSFFCIYCNSSKVVWDELSQLPAETTFQRRIEMRNHLEEKHMCISQQGYLYMECLLCSYRPTSKRHQNKALVNRMVNHMSSIHRIPHMVPEKDVLPEGIELLKKVADVPVTVEEENVEEVVKEDIVVNEEGEIVGDDAEMEGTEKKEESNVEVSSTETLPAGSEQTWRYFCMLCNDHSAMTSATALLSMTDGMTTLKALLEHIELLHLQKSDKEHLLKCPVCFVEFRGNYFEARDFPNQLIKHVTNVHQVVYSRPTHAVDLVEEKCIKTEIEWKEEKKELKEEPQTMFTEAMLKEGTYFCILCSDDKSKPNIDLYKSSPYSNLKLLTSHMLETHVVKDEIKSHIPCPLCPSYMGLHDKNPAALPLRLLNHIRSRHKVHCEKDRIGDRIIKKEATRKLMKFRDTTPTNRAIRKKMIKKKGESKRVEREVYDSFHCMYCLQPGESVTTANVLNSVSFPKKSKLLQHIDSTHMTVDGDKQYLSCPICHTQMGERDRLTQPSMRMLRHMMATHNVHCSQHLGLDPFEEQEEEDAVDEAELEKEEALMREMSDRRRVERRNLRAQARDELHDTYHCPYCTDADWFYSTLDVRYSQISFNSRLELVTHMTDHYVTSEVHDNQHLACPICDRIAPRGDQTTPSGTRILKHMSTVHEVLYSSRASQVPKRLDYVSYDAEGAEPKVVTVAEDVVTAVDERFSWVCLICVEKKMVFSCRKALVKHLELCHVLVLRNDTLISCPRCDWGYGSCLDFRRADSIVANNFIEHCLLSPGHTCRVEKLDTAHNPEVSAETVQEETIQMISNPREQQPLSSNENKSCFLCHEGSFETEDEAVEHIFSTHLLVGPNFRSEYIRCTHCHVRVLDANPFSEQKTLEDKKICASHLLHHMVHEHSTAVPSYWQMYNCNICGFQTLKLDTYQSHAQAMHDKTTEELEAYDRPRRPQNMQLIRKMIRRFNCTRCGAAFMRKHQLNSHLREIHDKKSRALCSTCGKVCNDPYSYINHSWKEHKLNVLNKPMVKCDECGEEMPNRLLRLHKKSHRSSNKRKHILCDICNKVIVTMAEYKRHRASHGQTTFRCEMCPFETDQPSYLPKHMAHVHKIGGHTCQFCNEMFLKEEYLESHIKRNHPDGQISNFCTLCQKKLCSRLSYENHMFKCHDVNVSRRSVTQCGLCGFRSLGNSLMKNHMLLHNAESSDYKCKECGNAFKSKDRYTTHMQVKHGEKAFKCNVCNFAFRTNSMLQRHIARLHTHEMVRCKDCTYQTYRLDLFEKHMKAVHGVGKQEEQELISQLIESDTEAFKRGTPMNIVEIDKKDKSIEGELTTLLNAATEGVADMETVQHIVAPSNLTVQTAITDGIQLIQTDDTPPTQHVVTSTGLQQVIHNVPITTIEETAEIPAILQAVESTEAAESLQALAALPGTAGQQIFQMENGETFQLDDSQVMVQTGDGVGETVVIETYDNINIKCSPGEDGVQYFYLTMEEQE